MSSKITPTVGRVVYYAPHANAASNGFHAPAASAPLAAIIAAVHDDGTLNLAVFDAQGFPHSRLDVPLVDEWGEGPKGGNYAYWMPYQLAQAGIKPMPGSQVDPSMAKPSIRATSVDQAQQAKLGQMLAAVPLPVDAPAPSVPVERIDALVASLTFETAHVPGTNSTVATARLPGGFVVAIGHDACVSAANFSAELGRKYAIEDAVLQARKALWDFEGYMLAHQLANPVKLDDFEQYRQQMAAIGCAAIGYWTPADGIHPDYDTVPLRDVATLYAKYQAAHQAMRAAMNELGVPQSGYPAPVANAYDHLHRAYYAGIEFASDYRPAPQRDTELMQAEAKMPELAEVDQTKTTERSTLGGRSEAIERALRTTGVNGHDEVLAAAKAYETYITNGQ